MRIKAVGCCWRLLAGLCGRVCMSRCWQRSGDAGLCVGQSHAVHTFRVIMPQKNYTCFFPCSLITNLQFHLLPVPSNFFCLAEGFRTSVNQGCLILKQTIQTSDFHLHVKGKKVFLWCAIRSCSFAELRRANLLRLALVYFKLLIAAVKHSFYALEYNYFP